MARFTPGGALDGTWDGDGHAEPVGTFDGELFAVELAAGGNVLAAGRDSLEAFAVKLGATGAPVPAFSGDGVAHAQPRGIGLELAAGGSALAFGVADGGARARARLPARRPTAAIAFAHFAVARFRADGVLDPLCGNGHARSTG